MCLPKEIREKTERPVDTIEHEEEPVTVKTTRQRRQDEKEVNDLMKVFVSLSGIYPTCVPLISYLSLLRPFCTDQLHGEAAAVGAAAAAGRSTCDPPMDEESGQRRS